jgi:hypothetical protein
VNPDQRPDPQRQADALIAEIRRKTVEASHEVMARAAHEAEVILQNAQDKARRQLQRAHADLEQARQRRIAQVAAELEAALRRRAAQHTLRQLAKAWPLLRGALERRWDSADARARWIAATLDVAQARLGPGAWRVRVAATLDPAAQDVVRDALAQRGVVRAVLEPEPTLRAGLIIESDGAVLDASPPALLVDRPAVEAALLAEMERGAAR